MEKRKMYHTFTTKRGAVPCKKQDSVVRLLRNDADEKSGH